MSTAYPGLPAGQATPRQKRTAAALAAAGFIVVSALAGCGTVGAAGTAPGSGSGQAGSGQAGSGQAGSGHAASGGAPMIRLLCAEPRGVNTVRVVHFGSRAQMGQVKPLPRLVGGITIRDPVKVRELVTLICRLPRMPRGVFHCPADTGGGYVLEFSAPGERLHAITLLASGCETVTGTGVGRPRWVARTPMFWAELAHLTGIASPAHI